MAQIFFSESFERLAPFIKDWVKEAIRELVPALIEVHTSEPLPEDASEYLSPESTSKLLGLSLPTLRKHTKAGIYTAYRAGNRKIQYKRSEIEKALHARRIDYRLSSKSRLNKKGGTR